MYKTSNLHLASLLILVNKAKVVSLDADSSKRKIFILNGEGADYQKTINEFFNREKMRISPFDLFITIKSLKGMLYDQN